MKTLEQLVRPNIRALKPYSTARDEYAGGEITTWLDANENPYENGVNRYPDPHQKELKRRIAALKGVREEQVFIGNGSDEAIDLAYRIFCRPGTDNAVSIAPTYGMSCKPSPKRGAWQDCASGWPSRRPPSRSSSPA